MTAHDDPIELLRRDVERSEPPLRLTGADIALAGGRRRRRRRRGTAAALVACAVMALGGLAVTRLATPDGTDTDGTTTRESLRDLVAAVAAAATSLGPDGWQADERRVRALDDQDRLLSGDDRAMAWRWQAVYRVTGDQRVEVNLGYQGAITVAQQRERCAGELEGKISLSCTATSGPGGLVLRTVVRRVRWSGGSLVVPTGPRRDEAPWLQRQVLAIHPDGVTVAAEDTVRADDVADAEDAWWASLDELIAVVTDPALRIDPPPGADPL